ncbi:amino acid adenylation domain-containing protein [Spirosoma flavum]|uniref:Amino acid adenylation domain-containing protein n=1 Tax=Spirosoma flavum TaxID=2048557 RepID=A0ABW6AL03_9BACT
MIENFTIPNVKVAEFDPFAGPEIVRVAPSIEPQMEIWTACLLGGDDANRAYNLSNSLRFTGVLDRLAMEQAIQALVRRHEALRSVFSANGEHIFILKELLIDITYQDVSAKETDEKELLLADYIKQDALHVFNLAQGPLFRVSLFKLSDKEHYLILTTHHSTRDGWSMGVMLQDLSALYSGYAQGITLNLPEAPSFAQYAEEQFQFSESDEYYKTEEFWVNKYKENVPIFDLPTDFPRPALRTFNSKRIDYTLDGDLVMAVKKMGLKAGCSFVTTLMSAFDVLMHRLSGQEDIIIGLPTAGQSATGNKRLVGHCVNLLPIRSHLEKQFRFSDFLKNCRQSVFDAHEHQRLTFSNLFRKLNIPRDLSRSPLVSVVFNIDMGMNDGVNFYGLTHHLASHPKEFENFELFLNATGSEKSLTLEWAYNTNLFKAETIYQMMAEFENILKTLVVDPSILIGDIKFISETNLSEKLIQWNDTQVDYPRHIPLHELIARTAAKYPNRTALVFNSQELSYQLLNETANQIANYLIQKGIKVGDIIGIALDRSPDMLIAMLATLKAGAAYLPLDPDYPQDRLTFMLADSSAKMLITSKKYSKHLHSQAEEILIENVLEESIVYAKDKPDSLVTGDDLAYLLYTSGSTGKPKGVLIEHHNLVNFLWSMLKEPGISQNDVLLAITTTSFDIAGLELYLPLVAGATILLADATTARDGHALLKLIKAKKVSIMQATPSTWRIMFDSGWDEPLALKVLCGGEALSNDLAEKLTAKCDELWNVYGPTETTIWSTVKKISKNELITIGRPINNTQLFILDEFLKPVAEGIVGELCIAGDGVARGYLNRQELTSEKFVKNPFDKLQKSTMYRTGDLGKFLENGEIQCLGRIDQQVKIRGHRIELGEIENVLSTIKYIKEAAVVAREDNPGDQRLVAYVVPESIVAEDKTSSWQERWNVIYNTGMTIAEQLSDHKDIKLEIDDWAQQSIKRIENLKPKRIMEVGCGDGQLLFALAPHATHYIGTDYSQSGIKKLQEKLQADAAKWTNVTTAIAQADDFSIVPESSLDMVLVHSVAQYFPDMAYLLRVIEQAVKAVDQGGCIFIGDMQGKSTLRMHHTFDQFQRSSEENTVADFKKIINKRVLIEDELVADPTFFYLLPHYIPAISAVNIQLREGKYLNETTKYHYDVWLYIGHSPEVVSADIVIDWTPDYTLERLEQDLLEKSQCVFQVKNIFNNRTAQDYNLLQTIDNLSGDALLVDARRKMGSTASSVDPKQLWSLGEKHNFSTHVRWSGDGSDNFLDVVFIPGKLSKKIPAKPRSVSIENSLLSDFINDPFKPDMVVPQEQIQVWKQQIRLQLPDYMVPNDFIILAKLPITPNGKIDRKALPEPRPNGVESRIGFTGPRTNVEKVVADIWVECLKLEKISVFDNFFELGGHSLIAVQIMTRLEKKTGKHMPLSTLFEYPTVEKLSLALEMDGQSIVWDSLVPIKPQGTKMPLYIVHGAGLHVLLFNTLAVNMDPDQPVFGLQAKGINSEDEPFDNIEDIASYYIEAIMAKNPDGPYALAGFSFGGIIAYEMSKRLLERGKEVKLLAMFDSYAYQSNYFDPWLNKIWINSLSLLKERLYLLTLLKESPRETIISKRESLKRRLNQMYRKIRYNEDRHKVFYNNYYKVHETNQIAARKYRLVPQQVSIDLFRAKKRSYYVQDFEFLGWKPFALKGIKVHEVPGDHNSLFTNSNGKEFAQVLQRVLDNC